MPPKKSIFVDLDKILRSIRDTAAEQRADAVARTVNHVADHRAEIIARTVWVPRDLQKLAGRPLTASERIRHQQAMRALEADGMVRLGARHVCLTDAGLARVAALEGPTP